MAPSSSSSDRNRNQNQNRQQQTLIPGLPDDISDIILSSLPVSFYSRLKPVSRSWLSFFSPPPSPSSSGSNLFALRRFLSFNSHLLCLFLCDPSLSPPLLLDPLTLSWCSHPVPPLPPSSHYLHLSNFCPVFLFPHLYILGGSHFDALAYPIDRPLASPAAFRIDLTVRNPARHAWSHLPSMPCARGSFACAAHESSRSILVAGGGSRHLMFPSDGSRIDDAEMLDAGLGEWRVMEGMTNCRAGCVGFVKGEEFWVMGGYGEYTTVSGVVPRDVYCRDVVAMSLQMGSWREVGNMWEEGERAALGKVVVLDKGMPDIEEDGIGVFMLDRNDIFRYNFVSNRWVKETSLRKKVPSNEGCCFAAMNGELYVLTSEPRGSTRKRPTVRVQVYNPKKRKWKCLTTNPPRSIDFKTAISCTIQL